jgi:hypothetical protein
VVMFTVLVTTSYIAVRRRTHRVSHDGTSGSFS